MYFNSIVTDPYNFDWDWYKKCIWIRGLGSGSGVLDLDLVKIQLFTLGTLNVLPLSENQQFNFKTYIFIFYSVFVVRLGKVLYTFYTRVEGGGGGPKIIS